MEYIEDQLSDIPDIRSRKMFGEYALYVGEKVVALVCDDMLFVKVTDRGSKFVGMDFPRGFPYPNAKAAYQIDADRLEDRGWLTELIRITASELFLSRSKKRRI